MEKNLGKKHGCFHCGCKFYDLNKSQPICPKCGTNQEEKKKVKKKQKEVNVES